jgi:hypothetical protein
VSTVSPGRAPGEYIPRLERLYGLSPAQIDQRLSSHGLNPAHLRNDDFAAFIADPRQGIRGPPIGHRPPRPCRTVEPRAPR